MRAQKAYARRRGRLFVNAKRPLGDCRCRVSDIGNIRGKQTHRIEVPRVAFHAHRRDEPIGRLETGDTAKRSGADNRARCLAAKRDGQHRGGDRGGRAGRRTARRVREISWIARGGGHERSELSRRRLAEHYAAGAACQTYGGSVSARPVAGIDRRTILGRQIGRVVNILRTDRQTAQLRRTQPRLVGSFSRSLDIERNKSADFRFAGCDSFGTQFDNCARFSFAGVQAPDKIEYREHHLPSMRATRRLVTRRTRGKAISPMIAATGQPMPKADNQRGTKSARKPILAKVTTALTKKTMSAVATTGKMNLALPSIVHPTRRRTAMCP